MTGYKSRPTESCNSAGSIITLLTRPGSLTTSSKLSRITSPKCIVVSPPNSTTNSSGSPIVNVVLHSHP
ncbi:MAG: hypothetical protein NZM43_05615, partial [Saprospiraceae bacterium]|nr:hypothetical protein [Saprospiraceae bacterium]MDW8483786.1 hypothetical protein [Saprospiraceae bacterium]